MFIASIPQRNGKTMTSNQVMYTQSCTNRESTLRLDVIHHALETVADPEIPTINIIELGIIAAVRVDDSHIEIDMTPTFAGCPALDVIREDISNAVRKTGETDVIVTVVYNPPWTSDRISDEGRRKLKEFGLAPPGPRCTGGALPDLEKTACPHCDSINTDLESIFGPTLCRSIHYCRDCLQSFEHFKAV